MHDDTPSERIAYLDHLRTALVILVVVHHVALVYGAAAPFYYVEPPFDDPLAFAVLTDFVLLNQAWFMGALFLLAGYFTPAPLDRKGRGGFLKSRAIRLGLPLLAFVFVLEPVARLGVFLMPASLTGITGPPSWSDYPSLLGLGPLWFALLLLIFDLGYAALPARWRRAAAPAAPGLPPIVAFTLALALVSYGLRIAVPLGREVRLVVPFLNFPTLAYLPQYLAFFTLGIVASRRGWLRVLPDTAGVAGAAAAVVAWVVLFPPAISGKLLSLTFSEAAAFRGGGTWPSALYALWDSITAVGLGLGALVFFRRFVSGDLAGILARHSYAVYVIHAPLIVWLAIALRGLALPVLAKFAALAVVAVPVCFAAAWAVRRVPPVARIL